MVSLLVQSTLLGWFRGLLFGQAQAVLDTVHVTVFDQSYVVSAGVMADTFFGAIKEGVFVSRPISALIMGIKRTFSRSC